MITHVLPLSSAPVPLLDAATGQPWVCHDGRPAFMAMADADSPTARAQRAMAHADQLWGHSDDPRAHNQGKTARAHALHDITPETVRSLHRAVHDAIRRSCR